MESLIKKLIFHAVQNDYIWALFNATILKTTRYAERVRRQGLYSNLYSKRYAEVADIMKDKFSDFTVKSGVFSGMKYPELKSSSGALSPKLFGLYEKEIQPVIEKICRDNYTEIVNIGCAEGYYAVGLAMRISTAKVFAYDINKEAIRLCEKMAKLNNVDKRIITGSFCDVETLKSIPFTKKGLIICDCEGYEKELFVEELIPFLTGHDLLIEIHDFIDINISSLICQRFEKTHEIETIQSVDDIKKAQTCFCEELDDYDLETRKTLLAEHRPAIMEWFYMQPRKQ